MANRIKLKGTSERSFDIGLTNKQTFDANNLTANRTWVLPDSNGTAGYVLSTDGTGNLNWVAQTGGGGGSSQARIEFTAASNGTGQTFTNAGISSFTNNTFANVFVNGVLLQTSEYSISGTTLTVSRYLSTGDNVIIAATSPGSVSGTLATTSGGTGLNTYTTGDILYASASNTLSKLPIGSTNQVLVVSGGVPTWAATPTKQYLYATASSATTTATTGSAVIFTTNNASNGISYNTTTGVISLTANKIYRMTARARNNNLGGSSELYFSDTSGNILIANSDGMAGGSVSVPAIIDVIYQPSTNQDIVVWGKSNVAVIMQRPSVIIQEL